MAKEEKKGNDFTVKSPFKTTKKEYKVGDVISLSSEKQIQYLQSINVI
jgi:hypothetical protein